MLETVPVDQIIRSKRRTIALEISMDARLIVRAPLFTPERTINKIILRKKSWILKKQKEAKEKWQCIPRRKFVDGERFPFLGNEYPLHIILLSNSPLTFDGHRFLLKKETIPVAEKMFTNWYRNQAIRVFQERLSWFMPISGVKPDSLKLSNARKRWGSCSARGKIHLNWRLIMAPGEIIDYVVVHEMIHVKEKNHSKKFWEEVKKILPEFKRQQTWLRKNGHLLSISGSDIDFLIQEEL